MQLWSQHTHTWSMWPKKFPSPWVHVILWWMQFFRKAQEFLERRGEKFTLYINSMGQTGHHVGDGPDLYPLRLSCTNLEIMERACPVSSWEVEVGGLWIVGQPWVRYKLKTRLDSECLACPWRMFSLLVSSSRGSRSTTWRVSGGDLVKCSHWWSGFTASGTLGSSSVVSFKSDSLKVQSFMVGQSQGRSMR